MTRTSLHLGFGEAAPRPNVNTYRDSSPIGHVEIDGGAIDICATDPAHLLLIAEAFTDAARMLSAQIDVDAARASQVPA